MTTSNDPWVVQAPKPKANAAAPDGGYIAEFVGVEDFTHEKVEGVKWKWQFKIAAGEHSSKMADRLTDREIDANTAAGQVIKGLLGREIAPGENVKNAIDACKGKRYMVAVGAGPKGGKSAVRQVTPVPANL